MALERLGGWSMGFTHDAPTEKNFNKSKFAGNKRVPSIDEEEVEILERVEKEEAFACNAYYRSALLLKEPNSEFSLRIQINVVTLTLQRFHKHCHSASLKSLVGKACLCLMVSMWVALLAWYCTMCGVKAGPSLTQAPLLLPTA